MLLKLYGTLLSSTISLVLRPSLADAFACALLTFFRQLCVLWQPSSFREPVVATRDAPLPPARSQHDNGGQRQWRSPAPASRRACALGGHAVDELRRLRVAV